MAKRYGWTSKYIADELYWEELWELVQIAANYDSVEKNEEYHFLFSLHADKKSKWKNLPLPFPNNDKVAGRIPKNTADPGGTKQLPRHIKAARRVIKKDGK